MITIIASNFTIFSTSFAHNIDRACGVLFFHLQKTDPPVILSLATLAQVSEVEVEEVYASAVHYWVSKGVLTEVPEPPGASSRGAGTLHCADCDV